MKIGVDASCWTNKRGYGRYTREVIQALLAHDQRNEYWLFMDTETSRHSRDLPERAHRVLVQTGRAATLAASAEGHRSLRDLWAMQQAVYARRRELDVFYFPAEYTFFPLRGRPRMIVTLHDTTAERYPEFIFPHWRAQMLWKFKVRWAIRQADLVLTVSDSARQDIIRAFGLRGTDVRVAPDAPDSVFRPVADGTRTRQVLASHGVPEGDRIILYVGGLSPHKNLATLIDAYANLIRERGVHSVKLVLVGDYQGDVFTSSYPALRRQVERLGLSSDVIFTGFVPDAELVHLYNAAQALVIPSLAEGFGLPAVEAMACGTPVVASRAGALPEVVGEAGLFFDPRVPQELSDHLYEVLSRPDLRDVLGHKGLKQARQFSWERSAQSVLAAFEEVTRDHASAPA